MKQNRTAPKRKSRAKAVPIKTSLLELMQELSRLATDDALVLAAVRSIFASYSVRLTRSLVPVRLVDVRHPTGLKTIAGRRRFIWA